MTTATKKLRTTENSQLIWVKVNGQMKGVHLHQSFHEALNIIAKRRGKSLQATINHLVAGIETKHARMACVTRNAIMGAIIAELKTLEATVSMQATAQVIPPQAQSDSIPFEKIDVVLAALGGAIVAVVTMLAI